MNIKERLILLAIADALCNDSEELCNMNCHKLNCYNCIQYHCIRDVCGENRGGLAYKIFDFLKKKFCN